MTREGTYPVMFTNLLNRIFKSIVLKIVEIIEANKPDETDRLILPMSSGVNIPPMTSAQITARPQNHSFVAERVVISNHPENWIVNDITIGNESQFAQSGDIPGDMFSSESFDNFVKFKTCPVGANFTIVVTYVGPSEKGESFSCGVLGRAIKNNLRAVA